VRVSAAVRELEKQYEAMRQRAEDAEGVIRVYEARDRVKEIAKSAVSSNDWHVHWKNGDDEPMEFTFAPGMWLLGLTETFLRHPMPFELRVEPINTNSEEKP
jgi:hypothetical protein